MGRFFLTFFQFAMVTVHTQSLKESLSLSEPIVYFILQMVLFSVTSPTNQHDPFSSWGSFNFLQFVGRWLPLMDLIDSLIDGSLGFNSLIR